MGRISKVIRQSRLNVDRLATTLRRPSSHLRLRLAFDAQARLVRTLGYLKAKLPHLHGRLRLLMAKPAARQT